MIHPTKTIILNVLKAVTKDLFPLLADALPASPENISQLAEKYLDTDEKRRSARAAYFAGAESARRCWDAFDGVKW